MGDVVSLPLAHAPRTVGARELAREVRLVRLASPDLDDHDRPRTRAECINGPRPCPFVACRHHLYLDVSERTGAIKLNFPDLEVEQMAESCALDVADRGGATLEEVGEMLNIVRERVRQIERSAMNALRGIASPLDEEDAP